MNNDIKALSNMSIAELKQLLSCVNQDIKSIKRAEKIAADNVPTEYEICNDIAKRFTNKQYPKPVENAKLKADIQIQQDILEYLNSGNHIITGISLPIKRIKVIEEEWNKLEDFCTNNNLKIILDGLDPKISFKIMINKLFSPPILGCIIGIVFGLSSMTNVLFSSNHYITNIVGILTISYKAYVPLLFMCTGVSLIAAKGLNLNTPFSKLHLFLSFVVRAVIVPLLGVGFVYLLRNTYGGIIETDRMFRFAIFVVWILPASPNFVIVVNLVKHFREELGYVLFWHNAFCFINLTIILLIYFLTVG